MPPPDDYARVHRAASESEALLVQRILQDNGVPVLVRSRQVPGYAEIIRGAIGVWGDILVPKLYEDEARRFIQEHLHALQEQVSVSRFQGIIPPLVTLFDDRGRIDEEANEKHVEFLIAAGVHGIFALGSTGETMHLTADERREFARLVVRDVDGRLPVLIGCLSPSTDDAVTQARYAQEIGADGVVVIPPYYWTPNDAAIEIHIGAVAKAIELPVVIYNFPAVVGRVIPAPIVATLAQTHVNVLGIKETLDSIGHLHEVLARVKPLRPEFSVLCGFEFHLLNTLLSGGDGAIPAIANFAPQLSVSVYEAFRKGRIEDAAAQMRGRLELATVYQLDAPFFVVVKEAMAMLGLIPAPIVRAPAPPLSDDGRKRLLTLLTSAGIL